jgi:hypothetical protein
MEKRESYYMVVLVFEDQFRRKHERYFQTLAYSKVDAKQRAKKANKKGLIFKLKTVK